MADTYRILLLTSPKIKALRHIESGSSGQGGGRMFKRLATISVRDGLASYNEKTETYSMTEAGKLALQLWSKSGDTLSNRKYSNKVKIDKKTGITGIQVDSPVNKEAEEVSVEPVDDGN